MRKFFFTSIVITLLFAVWIEAAEKPYLIFSGNANPKLAEEIANHLHTELGKAKVGRFNDQETNIQILENVRNKDVYVVQPTCTTATASVNDHLMELFLMIRTLKRASAKSVTAVIPYYGYARQDRKTKPRVPISASDVAIMLESAGVTRVVAVDLHCGQIQGFFHESPVDNLYSSTIFAPYFAKKKLVNPVVISPDAGGVERAKKFREQLRKLGMRSDFGIIIKQRKDAGIVDKMDLVGDVTGKDAIIVDDLCDTGGTLIRAAEQLKKFGARRVYACITHPVFSKDAMQKIGNSVFSEVIVTDTIPLREKPPYNIKQVSVAPLLADVISRISSGRAVSEVFIP